MARGQIGFSIDGIRAQAYSYYYEPGVREICHAVKQTEDRKLQELAVTVIADALIDRNLIRSGDFLIPAPQHTGRAEYTGRIGERIARSTGAELCDILRCVPHPSIYQQKQEGNVNRPEIQLYLDQALPADIHDRKIFFIDNVISTGTTFCAAEKLLGVPLVPLVYAVDEERLREAEEDRRREKISESIHKNRIRR